MNSSEFISNDGTPTDDRSVLPVGGESAGIPIVRCASITKRGLTELVIEAGKALKTVLVAKTERSVIAFAFAGVQSASSLNPHPDHSVVPVKAYQ